MSQMKVMPVFRSPSRKSRGGLTVRDYGEPAGVTSAPKGLSTWSGTGHSLEIAAAKGVERSVEHLGTRPGEPGSLAWGERPTRLIKANQG